MYEITIKESVFVLFYEIFEQLCAENRTSPSKVCIELGLSKTVSSFWKRSGGVPKRETLEKIAERFNVSVDYLVGKEKEKPAPIAVNQSRLFSVFAQLNEREIDEVLDFAEHLLSKRLAQAERDSQ